MSNFSNMQTGGGGGSYGQNYYDTSADFSTQPAPSYNPNQSGDFNSAINQAQYHKKDNKKDDDDEDDDEDSSFFSKAVSFISEHKDRFGKEDIDEQKVVGAHQALYEGGGGNEKNDADTLGSGAAMQALKMFMSSGDDDKGKEKGSGGGQDQNKLIGIAMAQAGKLWEQKNKKGEVVCSIPIFLGFLLVDILSTNVVLGY